MKIFNPDSVAVIRRKGDEYVREDIMTEPVLTGSSLTPGANRMNVIARLRRDPSVFLVLEPKDGHCAEKACHPSGFCFHVKLDEGENPSASLRVTFKDTLAYEESFTPDARQGEEENACDLQGIVVDTVIDLLGCIDGEDYSFVNDNCPFFQRVEPGEPINIHEAERLLAKEGFQTEVVSTVGWGAANPLLLVHENEVVLLGTRRFDGETLFLEMKRFFLGVDAKVVEEAVQRVQPTNHAVKPIHWEDGSWSFRAEMDDDVDKDNFIEKMLADLTELKAFVNRVEDQDGVGCEPWSITARQRHYFIYETMGASLKLSNLEV